MMIPRQDAPGKYMRPSRRRHLFVDRADAGVQLAHSLVHLRAAKPLVLGIPRGGVPVAREVARALDAELDVIVARKLGAPGQQELAIGAVAQDGTLYVNRALCAALDVTEGELQAIVHKQQAEAQRRERRFREGLPALAVQGRTVIVVDDGLATGATMLAAVRSLRKQHPGQLIAAVPVGAVETCAALRPEVDELICPEQPHPLYSVGEHYRDFQQTTDEQVIDMLREARARAQSDA